MSSRRCPVEANLLLGAYGRLFSLEIVSSTLRYLRSQSEVRERLERVYDAAAAAPRASRATGRHGRPAGSSRWSRSGARSWPSRGCSRSTSSPSGSPRCSCSSSPSSSLRLNEEEGVAILLVDQSASLAFSLCDAGLRPRDRSRRPGRGEPRARRAGGGSKRIPRRRHGGAGVTTFLQLVVVGISTGLGLRHRRHVARSRLPGDRDRELRSRRVRGARRPADVLARQAHVARPRRRARDAHERHSRRRSSRSSLSDSGDARRRWPA